MSTTTELSSLANTHPNEGDIVPMDNSLPVQTTVAVGRFGDDKASESSAGTGVDLQPTLQLEEDVASTLAQAKELHTDFGTPPSNLSRSQAPVWLREAVQSTKAKYPHDVFELVLRKANAQSAPEWRIECQDCPGKLYTLGPEESLLNFGVHLKNRAHRQNVFSRVQTAPITTESPLEELSQAQSRRPTDEAGGNHTSQVVQNHVDESKSMDGLVGASNPQPTPRESTPTGTLDFSTETRDTRPFKPQARRHN
ncbi:hypothetical protein AX16_003772 [Volvariella volvacea WC 439]|nr:hypothetical protein AX16_003772 [Volvariella volvacea WC 439]